MAKPKDQAGEEQSSPEVVSTGSHVLPVAAMFAGVGAAMTLAKKGEDRPLKAIRRAEEMRVKGAKRTEIHAETSKMLEHTPYAGVTYGADRMPRFEIDDSGAGIKTAAIPAGGKAFQKDFLHHPELYKAVPSAEHMTVEKSSTDHSGATGSRITIGQKHFHGQLAGREIAKRSAAGPNLHELQHHVQDIEGFAEGGTPDDFKKRYPNSPEKRMLAYRALAGEQEAEMTRKRQSMTAAERRARMPVPEIPLEAQIVQYDARVKARIDMTSISDAARAGWNALMNREMADGKPTRFRKVDPSQITADAETFQFKSGGDAAGVTDRLKGVTSWDPVAAGKAVVFERANGELVIADGHQRLGLAKRLQAQGQRVKMDAYVMRERDGWSPRDVRVYAAIKNMKESSGNALDMAKVMRERPDLVNGSLPLSDAKIKDAIALSKLSPDAFKMVVGGVIKPEHAAAVGSAVGDTTRHAGLLSEMAKAEIASAQQARLYVGQAMAAGTYQETTGSLFGEETNVRSLLAERTKVLDKAIQSLKSDKKIFGMLEREAGSIEAAGNKLAHEVNAARAEGAGRTAELVERLAQTRGPLSEMLDRAAREIADGKTPSQAARGFVREIQGTMKERGLAGLTGEAPKPALAPVDPNQVNMFGGTGERPGWSDAAREQSAKVRASKAKGQTVGKRAKAMMDSELPPRLGKGKTTPEAAAKWEKELAKVPQDDAEKRLLARKKGERIGQPARTKMMADDMFGGPSTKDKIAAAARAKEAKGRTGDPMNVGLFSSAKDQTDLVDRAKQGKPAVTKESIMAKHKKDFARIEGKDVRAAEIAKFTRMNGKRPLGPWSTRDLAAANRSTIKERGGDMTYDEWIDKLSRESNPAESKPHAITTKPPRESKADRAASEQQIRARTVIAPDAHKYMKYAELHADGRMVLTGKGGQILAERQGVSNAEFDQVLKDAGIRTAAQKGAKPSRANKRSVEAKASKPSAPAYDANVAGIQDASGNTWRKHEGSSAWSVEGKGPAGWSDAARAASAEARASDAPSTKEVLKAKEIDFGGIKKRIGNSLAEHSWDVDNGGKVTARVKTTMKGGGEIKTAYLHVAVERPDGAVTTYKETAKGTFKSVGFTPSRTAPTKVAEPKPLMKDPAVKRLLKEGLVTRDDVKTSKTMDELKSKATASATNKMKDRDVGFRGALNAKQNQMIAEWVEPSKAASVVDRIKVIEKRNETARAHAEVAKSLMDSGQTTAAKIRAALGQELLERNERDLAKLEKSVKPQRVVTLGDGRKMPLGKYTEAWKKAKAMPANKPVRGTPSDPTGGGTAADVLREMRAGMMDRINQKDPNYGIGRKWDDSWQNDARRLSDTLKRKSEVPAGEAHPVDLRSRIAGRLAEGTFIPPKGGERPKVKPQATSGLRGTQNAANLEAIIENRQKNANVEAVRTLSSKAMAAKRKEAPALSDVAKMAGVKDPMAQMQETFGPRKDHIPGVGNPQQSYWSYKTPPTPTVADLPEGAFKGTDKEFSSLSPGMRREIARSAQKANEAKAAAVPHQMTPEGQEARFVNRMVAAGSTKSEAELKADFAAKQGTAKPKRSKTSRALSLLAPVAVGTAMLAASNQAKAAGASRTEELKAAGAAGVESAAVMTGFTLGAGVAIKGLVRAGMTVARAAPVVQGAFMAYGAVSQGLEAYRAGGGIKDVAKGAAKGAWDMSLPGMVVNTTRDVSAAISERNALEAPQPFSTAGLQRFQKASADYKARVEAASPRVEPVEPDGENKPRGWANAKVQAAAQAARGRKFSGEFKDGISH